LRLIFSLPGYLFSYDIVNFFSTDHGVAGADVAFGALGLPGMGLHGAVYSLAISSAIECLFCLYRNFSARVPKNLQVLQAVPHTA
jgi:hypothetical protein